MLTDSDYTVWNALSWGMFQAHKQRIVQGDKWNAWHLVAAALEAIPLFGQMVSLVELAVTRIWIYFEQKQSVPPAPLKNVTVSPKSSNNKVQSVVKSMSKCPEKPVDMLLAFYRGHGADIEERTLKEIWSFSQTQMEECHDYIQWLFPSRQPSQFNPNAPLLTADLIKAMKDDPVIRKNIMCSFVIMLGFYGFEYDPLDESVKVANTFAIRSKVWLNPGNHNFLRISRILGFMKVMGFHTQAKSFMAALTKLKQVNNNAKIIGDSYYKWLAAAS